MAVCVTSKRKHWTIFLQRTRDGHRQSDKHWNRFKDNAGETSERLGRAHTGFSERTDTILKRTELKNNNAKQPLANVCSGIVLIIM